MQNIPALVEDYNY